MTLIMAWREAEMERLWLASDSRLTSPGMAGGAVRLSDSAAKILSIDQVLFDPHFPPEIRPVISRTTYAFAYAGSSLIAFQAYTAVQALWGRLLNADRVPPSIDDSARHLAKFVDSYFRDLGAAGHPCEFEGMLAGQCPVTGVIKAYSIRPEVRDSQVFTDVRLLDITPGRLHAFGSQAGLVSDLQPDQPPLWAREPLRFLRRELAEDLHSDIGGGVQVAFMVPGRFDLTYDCQPRFGEPLDAGMRYRGFPFSDIGMVGPCIAGIAGIA